MSTFARYKFLYNRGKSYVDLLLGSFVIYLTLYRVLIFFNYELHPIFILLIIPATALLFIGVGKFEDSRKGFTYDVTELQKRNPQIQRIDRNIKKILSNIKKRDIK